MTTFQCPCGKILAIDERWAGKMARCASCGQVSRVPLPGEQSQTPAPPAASAQPPDAMQALADAAQGTGYYQQATNLVCCRDCGQTVSREAAACPHCGAPCRAVPRPRPANVPSHLTEAILVTLFCCLPFGIVSIVYASQVGARLAARDYHGAVAASRNANSWAWIGVVVGFVGIIFVAIANFIAIANHHGQ